MPSTESYEDASEVGLEIGELGMSDCASAIAPFYLNAALK